MKKVVVCSLLSSVVGCAQFLPQSPSVPLVAPIETIHVADTAPRYVEPPIVAKVNENVALGELYLASDDIALSEQQNIGDRVTETKIIKEPVNNASVDVTVANTAQTQDPSVLIEPIEPSVIQPQTIQSAVIENDDDDYHVMMMHGYTIQFPASRDEATLTSLLGDFALEHPAWMNKKTINNRYVYTLLVGHFVDHQQAQAVFKQLPERLQQQGAFVRNFYDIENTDSPKLKPVQ